MKLFMQYLRQKWRVLAAFTLFAAVLAVCFALYRLPLRATPDPAQLPSPAGICEEDYQALVRALDERARRAETETDARMRAMIDY